MSESSAPSSGPGPSGSTPSAGGQGSRTPRALLGTGADPSRGGAGAACSPATTPRQVRRPTASPRVPVEPDLAFRIAEPVTLPLVGRDSASRRIEEVHLHPADRVDGQRAHVTSGSGSSRASRASRASWRPKDSFTPSPSEARANSRRPPKARSQAANAGGGLTPACSQTSRRERSAGAAPRRDPPAQCQHRRGSRPRRGAGRRGPSARVGASTPRRRRRALVKRRRSRSPGRAVSG